MGSKFTRRLSPLLDVAYRARMARLPAGATAWARARVYLSVGDPRMAARWGKRGFWASVGRAEHEWRGFTGENIARSTEIPEGLAFAYPLRGVLVMNTAIVARHMDGWAILDLAKCLRQMREPGWIAVDSLSLQWSDELDGIMDASEAGNVWVDPRAEEPDLDPPTPRP